MTRETLEAFLKNRTVPFFLISGILLILPFPLFNLEIIAWFSLVPLLLGILKETPRNSFLFGYLCGIIWNIGTLYWTHVYHPLVLPLVVFILSFYPAVFCLVLNILSRGLIPQPGQEQVYQTRRNQRSLRGMKSRSHVASECDERSKLSQVATVARAIWRRFADCHVPFAFLRASAHTASRNDSKAVKWHTHKQSDMKSALRMMCIAPLLWTSLEYIRSLGFLGFPWNSLGYSQYKFLPVIQIAEFTGVFGVSFLIVFVNSSLALAFKSFHKPGRALRTIVVAGIAFCLCVSWGSLKMKSPLRTETKPIRVALIQPNFSTDFQWSESSSMIMEHLSTLSFEAGLSDPDLIIWPESAIGENPFKIHPHLSPPPIPLAPPLVKGAGRIREGDKWLREKIEDVLRETGAYLLTGAPYSFRGEDYNSAFLISPSCKLLSRYDKIHLVPGGEYFPIWRHKRVIEHLLQDAGEFTPGENYTVFEIPDKGKFGTSVRFSVLICFEGTFGDLTRRFVKEGADFLINITNDAWSHSKTSHYQHASVATFRAVENRLYFVRVGNSGVSRVINPKGAIETNLDANRTGFLVGEVFPPSKKTFYTRRGDIFAKLALVATFLLLLIGFRRKSLDYRLTIDKNSQV